MSARVLAHVECGHLKAKRLSRPAHPGHGALGDQLTACAGEGRGHEVEVGDEFIGMGVFLAFDMGEALLQSPVGVDQAGPDVRALETIWLGSRASALPLPDLGQHLAVRCQRRFQLVAHRRQTLGHRELVSEIFDQTNEMADAAIVLEQKGLQGGVRFHAGVPIAVAADPGPETYRAPIGNDPEPRDLERHPLAQGGHDLGRDLHQVVEGGACLLHRVRLLEPQLVGLPYLVDQFRRATIDEVQIGIPGGQPLPDELG